MDRLANLGLGVSVSHMAQCPLAGPLFARTIHIKTPGQAQPCHVRENDLCCDLIEEVSLGRREIQRIFDYSKGEETLLIHCAAGMCRSPTVAVIALVARGCSIGDANRRVIDGTCGYSAEPIYPWLSPWVMTEIWKVLCPTAQ